jgi:alkylation response protein AidB-like acyl-CoA dehydrogenase
MAVEYAKDRVQFGRPIGSFQAIKHKCADMLLEVESAKSAAYYAVVRRGAERRAALGGVAGQGLLLGGLLPRHRREHPDPRWHRLHLGAPGPPLLQAGEEPRSELLFGDPTYHRELLAQRIGI